MGNALFYRWLGWGTVPKKFRGILEEETIVLLDEGVGGIVILRNFRGPGRYHSYKSSIVWTSIVLTKKTFAVFTLWRPLVYMPLSDERLKDIDLSIDKRGRLRIFFDAAQFGPKWKGTVECRLKTDKGKEFLGWLASAGPDEAD